MSGWWVWLSSAYVCEDFKGIYMDFYERKESGVGPGHPPGSALILRMFAF